MSESDPDLSLVSTDDMIAELKKRHDAIVIVRERRPDGKKTETFTDYWGGLSYCIGLASRAHARLLNVALGPDAD